MWRRGCRESINPGFIFNSLHCDETIAIGWVPRQAVLQQLLRRRDPEILHPSNRVRADTEISRSARICLSWCFRRDCNGPRRDSVDGRSWSQLPETAEGILFITCYLCLRKQSPTVETMIIFGKRRLPASCVIKVIYDVQGRLIPVHLRFLEVDVPLREAGFVYWPLWTSICSQSHRVLSCKITVGVFGV